MLIFIKSIRFNSMNLVGLVSYRTVSSLTTMDNSKEWIQQRVHLLLSHYQEWNELLLVQDALQCSSEGQQRLKTIQFTGLDVSSAVNNPDWLMLMILQSQERDSFVKSNGVNSFEIDIKGKAGVN